MANQVNEVKENTVDRLRVYRKKSTFEGATEKDFWYTATLSSGHSVMLRFKCPIAESVANDGCFEISDVMGNMTSKEVEYKKETYTNYTYYIDACEFHKLPSVKLPL